jgi:hypothetical protein
MSASQFTEPLGSGKLDSEYKVLCTPPSPKQYDILTLLLTNNSLADVTVSLKFQISGVEKAWITNLTLIAGNTLDFLSAPVGLKYGDQILGKAGMNGSVDFNIFGKVQIQ